MKIAACLKLIRSTARALAVCVPVLIAGPVTAVDQDAVTSPALSATVPMLFSEHGLPRRAEPLSAGTVEPQHNADLLDRMRSGFSLPVIDDPSIDDQLRWYARHPEYMQRVLQRSAPYLHHIVQTLSARGMPGELALLPIVESAFDPFAYSHGRAAGLWQFIPGTGKRYGLKQNWWYDGRRDVVASTDAALRYLQKLHNQFGGDWLLAVAAYNSGEGKVAGAIRRNASRQRPTDFWNLKLPRETRSYVPKLLALKALFEDPSRYQLTLPSMPDEAYFVALDTGGQIDLALAANMAGVDLDTIYRLNPGFNRWATDPDGPHRLLIPVANVNTFQEQLEQTPVDTRIQWQRYKIRTGDTLSTIAARFGVTTAVLSRANDLQGSGIRAGDHLLIPDAAKPFSSYALSADQRLATTQNRQDGRAVQRHVVASGESLWTIAQHYGVGVRSLASWNGMAPGDTLSVGRQLVVRGGKQAIGPGKPGSETIAARTRRVEYVVRSGDSLSRISSRFRVSVNELKDWNSLQGQRYLKPGQRLVMYVDVTRQSGG